MTKDNRVVIEFPNSTPDPNGNYAYVWDEIQNQLYNGYWRPNLSFARYSRSHYTTTSSQEEIANYIEVNHSPITSIEEYADLNAIILNWEKYDTAYELTMAPTEEQGLYSLTLESFYADKGIVMRMLNCIFLTNNDHLCDFFIRKK